jgi:redox-sensitive bicupin YhaK (pirin superfamily)
VDIRFEGGAMITFRPAAERGVTRWDWLDSRHTFSFGEYHDPQHMGFRRLRVINDDRIAPGAGFGTHGHRDMEILSYVLEGGLEHKDSMGNGSIIRAGDLQFMRAGTGVRHSEYNPSATEPGHFLQIWIEPDTLGLAPAYAQQPVDAEAARRGFALVASGHGEAGAIEIRQDVRLYVARPDDGATVALELAPGRHAWLHVARGSVRFAGRELTEGDGAALSAESRVEVTGVSGGEVLLFDLG